MTDLHDLQCSYDDCEGTLYHLQQDARGLREAAGEVLALSGFKDRLDHADLTPLRRAVRNYDNSSAT